MPTAPVAVPPAPNPDRITYPWDTPRHNFHNVRVLCDLAGLTLEEKNILCACIYQESGFHNDAVNRNRNAAGDIVSTDYGLCQVNDFYHVAPTGSPFPSVPYVLNEPAAVVKWMIGMYQHGALKQWVSYSSGAYVHWLSTGSPMWALQS